MNRRSPTIAFVTLFAVLAVPDKAWANVIVSWNWNDGTTQGWTGSKSQLNVGNQFEGNNVLNGSLQLFGPFLPADALIGLSTISFDLSILSYSSVSSPSDLAFARLQLNRPLPEDPDSQPRYWLLNLSNLAFGQTRSFNLSILDALGSGSLAGVLDFNFIFADAGFNSNTSSALLDNFVVSGAVPEPSTFLLLSPGLLGLWYARRNLSSMRLITAALRAWKLGQTTN